MLKLPLCPYCGARFLYPTVRENRKRKTGICPHCRRVFRIDGKKRYFLFLCALVLLIGLNWFLLTIPAMNPAFLLSATALGVTAAELLIPFTIRYRKTGPAEQKSTEKK